MEYVKKIEKLVEGWLKPLPRLPINAQKWIAINIWWLELVGVIILTFSGIGILGSFGLSLGMTTAILGVPSFSGLLAVPAVISLVSMGASVVVMAMAVKPLKDLKRKGWELLFIAILINCFSVVLSAVLRIGFFEFISSIFSGAVGILISAYILFEIRTFFVSVKK